MLNRNSKQKYIKELEDLKSDIKITFEINHDVLKKLNDYTTTLKSTNNSLENHSLKLDALIKNFKKELDKKKGGSTYAKYEG